VAHYLVRIPHLAARLLKFIGPSYWGAKRDTFLGKTLIESANLPSSEVMQIALKALDSLQGDTAGRLMSLKSRLIDTIDTAISKEMQLIAHDMQKMKEIELESLRINREELDREKKSFDEEKKKFYELTQIQTKRPIKLNIGGQKYDNDDNSQSPLEPFP